MHQSSNGSVIFTNSPKKFYRSSVVITGFTKELNTELDKRITVEILPISKAVFTVKFCCRSYGRS